MNFDVYEINKIFYDQIRSSYDIQKKKEERYSFDCSGKWNCPPFGVNLNLMNEDMYHWYHHSSSLASIDRFYYLRDRYSFYKIDQNRIMHCGNRSYFYFLISGKEAKVSLRELILFIIYMKHLCFYI